LLVAKPQTVRLPFGWDYNYLGPTRGKARRLFNYENVADAELKGIEREPIFNLVQQTGDKKIGARHRVNQYCHALFSRR
jgi:hypothetical protein